MNLAEPGWLVLLILLPLLAIGAVLVFRLRKRQWDAFAAPRLRNVLIRRGSSIPRWLSLAFLLAACACLIGALSRPQGDDGVRTEKALGRNVLIALDLSRSMRVTDVKPDRLAQAKIIIYELLEALPNDRVGIVGFAGKAHLFAPLTVDHAAVRETVEQIDENWTSVGGSNLSEALSLSIQTLKETGQSNNTLVILSDGEENEGDIDTMIAEAERDGVYIFSVGVGTEDGGFVPNANYPDNRMLDGNGQPILSRLHADVLRKLATETNGRHATAGSGADIPAMVTAAVQQMDTFEVKGRERRIVIEFYQWLLFPGILFLILSIVAGTRWRGIRPLSTALLAFAIFLPTMPQASADEVSDAKKALEDKEFKKAADTYKKLAEESGFQDRAALFRIGEGTAAYRSEDYRGARAAFSSAMNSDDKEVRSSAHFGLGNTLFQLGWQGLADTSYPEFSENPPDLEQFKELVLKRLASMQESDLKDKGDTSDFVRLDSMMVNWADAIRHYQSAVSENPSNEDARHNEEIAMTYLRKLQEILEEEEKKAEQSMPQPMPGQGQPGEGEEGEGEGDGEGQGGQQRGKGNGGDDEDEDANGGKDGDEKEDGKGSDGDQDPNESSKDRARRILGENADLEKGPLGQGRYEYRDPAKDW